MDVVVFLLGFIFAAIAGWMALKAEVGAGFAVLTYGCTFLVVLGVGVLLRRWRG